MKKTVAPIDYLTKDYEGFRNLMIEKIPTHAPEWTDTSQTDMGIVLIELLAYGLDILSFYQDRAFNENFLSTAKSRKSVINLCRLLGYELKTQTPAKHKLVFTRSADYWDREILVPAKTRVSTDPTIDQAIMFELDSDIYFPAGETSETAIMQVEGTATQGAWITETDILGVGNSQPFQKFNLNFADVIVDTLQVMTEGKYLWTPVKDFLSSTKDDRHFKIYTDEDNLTKIEMGSGLTGMVVPSGHIVTATYRVGGGEVGNVGLNTINTFVDTDYEGIASFTNPEVPVEYGTDPEDIEVAKINAPKNFRTVTRAVTKQDFEDLCLNFGVMKAKCLETFNENDEVNIYIVPFNYDLISTEGLNQLKQDLSNFLDERKIVHIKPVINPGGDGVYQTVNITVDVVTYPTYRNEEVKDRVEESIHEAFNIQYMDFGEDVTLANIFKTVMLVDGVKDVTISQPLTSVEIPDGSVDEVTKAVTHPKIAVLGNVVANVTGGVS